MCSHFKLLTNIIVNKYKPKSVLEIGCNDGVLLNQINNVNNNILCIGIDPSITIKNITNPRILTYNTFFDIESTNEILKNTEKLI